MRNTGVSGDLPLGTEEVCLACLWVGQAVTTFSQTWSGKWKMARCQPRGTGPHGA